MHSTQDIDQNFVFSVYCDKNRILKFQRAEFSFYVNLKALKTSDFNSEVYSALSNL